MLRKNNSTVIICDRERNVNMKGYARSVDELGRITLPMEIRRANDINEGDALTIKVVPEGILLAPLNASCAICGGSENLLAVDGVSVCLGCGRKIREALK